jgi:hypothetical protein
MERGTLSKAKNNEKDIISYEDFKRLLQVEFEESGIKDIIYSDVANSISNQYQAGLNSNETADEIEKKPFVVANEKKEDVKTNLKTKKQRFNIELLDGTFESLSRTYLENEIIMKDHSNNAYDFNEKNYIVVPSLYKQKEVLFEMVQKKLLENKMIKNYSLVFHNNGRKDDYIYVYRLIDGEFILLKKILAGFCMDFEIYNRNGIKKFLELFRDSLSECLGDIV